MICSSSVVTGLCWCKSGSRGASEEAVAIILTRGVQAWIGAAGVARGAPAPGIRVWMREHDLRDEPRFWSEN